jgi:hypothetical protein
MTNVNRLLQEGRQIAELKLFETVGDDLVTVIRAQKEGNTLNKEKVAEGWDSETPRLFKNQYLRCAHCPAIVRAFLMPWKINVFLVLYLSSAMTVKSQFPAEPFFLR